MWPILFLYTATGKRLIAFLLHQCERQIILTYCNSTPVMERTEYHQTRQIMKQRKVSMLRIRAFLGVGAFLGLKPKAQTNFRGPT